MLRRMALLRLAWAAALTLSAVACLAQFGLRNGDRVVFYGDSITDQRLYTTFTETFIVTRFPKLNVTFTHSGWGGDRVTGGGGGPVDLRLKRDVMAYKPTVMTVMLGMNDAAYRQFDDGIFKTYSDGYRHIVAAMKGAFPKLRMTLIRPSPFDDVTRAPGFPGGYNATLVRYGDFVQELAKEHKLDTADLCTDVVAMLERANASNPALAKKIIEDRVHPGPAGQLAMAACLLKAWKAPAVVSSVEIDAAAGRVSHAENCTVSQVTPGNQLSWTQLDKALPMPVDPNDPLFALVLASSDFTNTLNRQILRVSGLASGSYRLTIDGEEVGSYSAVQLETGVNLALAGTPMMKQAARVHGLTLAHNQVHFTRWRQVQLPLEWCKSPKSAPALAAMDAWDAEIVRQQHAAAQPLPHRFALQPAQ